MTLNKFFYFFLFSLIWFNTELFAQLAPQSEAITYTGSGSYWMIERTDLRRYDNGQYTGLTQRQVRSFIHPVSAPARHRLGGKTELILAAQNNSGSWYEGSFFVEEKTLSNSQQTARGLDESIPSEFFISDSGILTMIVDNGFPTFRSFPAYPREAIYPGSSWTAEAVRSVDPLNKGVFTKIPMLVQYTFIREEIFQGEEVLRIQAKWATRYGGINIDWDGDEELREATGSHSAQILVLKDTGTAILIQDLVDETFKYSSGKTVQFKGSINLFTEFPPSVNTDDIITNFGAFATIADNATADTHTTTDSLLADGSTSSTTDSLLADGSTSSTTDSLLADSSTSSTTDSLLAKNSTDNTKKEQIPPTNNMLVEKTPAGIRLSVRNIEFLPDSSEFKQSEYERLDKIAQTLKTVPNAQFLIEGHTADTGNPRGEKAVSIARAKRTAEELAKRGIPSNRFITNGFGAERPIQSNETPQGMAANRRVEITILE